jgi:hypothetical protein
METDDYFDPDEDAFYAKQAAEAEAGWRWHQLGMGDTPINVNSRQFDALLLQQFDDVPF